MPKLTTSSATTTFAWTMVPGSSHTSAPAASSSAYRCLTAADAAKLFDFWESTTRTLTPRRAAASTRSTMSGSVRYGFITSRRSPAPSICSRTACEAATKPPGIT